MIANVLRVFLQQSAEKRHVAWHNLFQHEASCYNYVIFRKFNFSKILLFTVYKFNQWKKQRLSANKSVA